MNTKDIGNIGEHIAILELLELGVQVSRPLGDNSRYDLILDIQNNLYTAQVKSTNSSSQDLAEFWLSSSQAHRGQGRATYDVDLFLLVDIPKKVVLVLPNLDTKHSIKIRYKRTESRNQTQVNLAEDFLLQKFISNIL